MEPLVVSFERLIVHDFGVAGAIVDEVVVVAIVDEVVVVAVVGSMVVVFPNSSWKSAVAPSAKTIVILASGASVDLL